MPNVVVTAAPVLQAIVQKLKAYTSLDSVLTGGIHEGLAPEGSGYPLLTYSLHYAPRDYDWSNVLTRAGVDIVIFSGSQVQARNLAQLVIDALQDAEFDFDATALGTSEQSTLLCRLEMDLYSTDLDGTGMKVYGVGGLWEIWVDQPAH